MNKKQKGSIILASLASIAVAGSVIAGATYALFTSESKTNIAVSSGKVKVSAVVKDLLTYTGDDLTGDVEEDASKIKKSTEFGLENGEFKNGGTANYDEDTGTLSLDKMTPGDKVTFTINVTNESTVNVKYRTVIKTEEDNDLFAGLKVTIDGTTFSGEEVASPYSNLFPGSDPDDINVSIELPSDANDVYQDKSCKIVSTVEAIQGNAHVGETVSSKADLQTALDEGTDASLSEDLSFDNAEYLSITKDTVIYGNGKSLVADPGKSTGELTGRVFDVDSVNDITITLVDLNIVGPTYNEYNRGITLWGCSNVKVVLDNCTVSANHYPLYISGGTHDIEIVAKHTTLAGYSAIESYSTSTKATFTDCTLKGINQWTNNVGASNNTYGVIILDSAATNSELVFNNCTIDAFEQGVAQEGTVVAEEHLIENYSNTSSLTFTNCKFYHGKNDEDKTEIVDLTAVKAKSYAYTDNIYFG